MSQADDVPRLQTDHPECVNGHEPSDRELLLRFVNGRQESAFETLVRRHGPMVLGVCRRVLGDIHRAEDAFQATFLALVRRSEPIRHPELLANWLYGVAFRISRKARVDAARRDALEREAPVMSNQEEHLDLEWAEVKHVLDEELSQLPEKYRLPLTLCYLTGMTNVEAAQQLGWPTGSISERLAQAREALRKRLNRRGLALSAGLFALLLSQKAASAAVPATLVESTVTAAVAYAGHPAAVIQVSSTIAAMANEAVKATATTSAPLKLSAAIALFALALVISGPTIRQSLASSRFNLFGGMKFSRAGCGTHSGTVAGSAAFASTEKPVPARSAQGAEPPPQQLSTSVQSKAANCPTLTNTPGGY